MTLEQIFPPFAVRISCGPVTLRALREQDAVRVAELAQAGIHAPDQRPFSFAWNLVDNQPWESLRFYYRAWAACSPQDWNLLLAVERDGQMVGCQDLLATDFATTRVIETGSWLGLAYQGQGTGTLMRQAAVAFGLDHLGAAEMRSAAWSDNPRSRRVSEKVGYQPNGYRVRARDGRPHRQDQFVVTPQTFVRPPYPVVVSGLAELRSFLGLGPTD
ncbi:MAG: GNAT family N-acetyltransferase [Actinomycetia bacterium]|nr:GNAT family N-acetyltransferase [Actinomycetes bacterium]